MRISLGSLDPSELRGSRIAQLLSNSWRQGEVDRKGQVTPTSGCTLLLAEGSDGRHAGDAIERALQRLNGELQSLRAKGAEFQIDIGVFHGTSDFVWSIQVSPSLITRLADVGCHLALTAYPCSPEDDACEEEC